MPFQYDTPDRSRATNTIAELMMRGPNARAQAALQSGDAQAQAAQTSGNAWGHAFGTIGQMAANIPQEMAQQKQLALRGQAQQIEMERMQAQKAAAQREVMEDQALRQLFSKGEPPPEAIFQVVGPERGSAILKGFAALRAENQKAYSSTQTLVKDVLAGMEATPEALRAEVYPGIRSNLLERGIIQPGDAPETYDPQWFAQARAFGKEPKEAKAPEPFTLGEGQIRYDAANQEVARGPAKPEPREANATEAQLAVMAGRGDPAAVKALALLRAQHPQAPAAEKAGMWVDRGGQAMRVQERDIQPGDKPFSDRAGAVAAKLPAGMATTVAASQTSLAGLDRLESIYKDEYIGPVAGRANAASSGAPALLQGMLPKRPEGYEEFAAEEATLKNQVIQAITGAAVGVQEQGRIMNQIPDINDPPLKWKAKAKATRRNLNELIANQIKMGTGAQDPLTEGTTATIPVNAGGKPTAAELIRRYGG